MSGFSLGESNLSYGSPVAYAELPLTRLELWKSVYHYIVKEVALVAQKKREEMALAHNDLHRKMQNKTNWRVGLVSCIFLMTAVAVALLVMQKRRGRKSVNRQGISEDFTREILTRKLSYQELAFGTKTFSSKRILGQGGTGCVYKGYLRNSNHIVAVKKIFREYRFAEEVFTTELKIMSQLECRNIVSLIGWSNDQGELLLVYDYMQNGSLDTHLFGNGTHRPWKVRCNIALGLASALLYLHGEAKECIMHRDIKSANVMLDSNFDAKLGDFGVAMFLDSQLGFQTTKVIGTFGYIAPEYYHHGKAGKESDIYSFGVVALEIASGKRKHEDEESQIGVVEWVWELYGAGKILEAADERLNMDFDEQEMERLLIVGLWCAHPVDKLRPTVRQAIQVLKCKAPLPDLPNEMPNYVYDEPPSPADSIQPSITCSLEIGC